MAFKAKPSSEIDISDSSGKQELDGNGVRLQEEEDVKVDIMECGKNLEEDEFREVEEEDLFESSSTSSFGDSMCARDDDGEDDAQSMLSREYPLPETFGDGTEFLGLRKKKVTDEWRRFSQPLSWRCKWLELKVREILSQARGYEREVRDCYETKEFDLEKSKWDGYQGKSIPFRDQAQRMKVFKRRRRERVEETTDVAAYRSNHNIFSYADKRMPATVRAQNLDPDFGTGRKATSKEDGSEDDCLVSELDCSDDFLPRLLCKIEEAQERTTRMKNRIEQLTMESQNAPTSSTPQTIAPCQKDVTAQKGKQRALVEEPLTPQTAARTQKEATVQIGRQRISADHTEDIFLPQVPLPIDIGGGCLDNDSPIGLRFHPLLDDLLMDESDMNMDETDMDEHFRTVMDQITGVSPASPEEEDTEEDPTPEHKRRKTSD